MRMRISSPLVGGRMFGAVPWRSRWRLFAGVFLAFATIGILLDLCLVTRRPWYGVAYSSLCAGLISAGWAYAWQSRRRLLLLVGPITILYQPVLDFLFPEASLAQAIARGGIDPARVVEAAACLACVVLAYILFISYVRGEETRNQRIRIEMGLAQRIHESLVPPVNISISACEALGTSLPSSEMGGDLLDCFPDNGALTMIVADVSGHGVAAGVLMAMLKSAVRSTIHRRAKLAEQVVDINRVMHELTTAEKFATFCCVRVNPLREVEYALAGHLPIYWHQATSGRLVELPNEHLPLGVVEESDFASHTIQAGAGDLLVLLTDGLVETMNPAGELFGEARIRSILLSHASRSLGEIQAALLSAVSAFGPRVDDQTLLLIRVR